MFRQPIPRKEPVLRSVEPSRAVEQPVHYGDDPGPRGAAEPALRSVLITTTPGIEGRPVASYLGIVTGEVVVGADILQPAPAPKKGLFGRLRSRAAEDRNDSLSDAREKALRDMKSRAAARGADAVVGVTLATNLLGESLVVTATGTAVRLG